MSIKTVNPFTEEMIREYHWHDSKGLNIILKKTNSAFLDWRYTSFKERTACFKRLIDIILEEKEYYAQIMSEEMGRPIVPAIAEIEKCSWVCQFYAENAEEFLSEERIITDASESYVRYEPLGVILAIMPWNFPYWQVLRFAAPNIMAGNTVLLKHSPNVTGCAIAIEKLFHKAGFPEGVLKTVLADIPMIPEIVKNPIIKGVTLTGSVRAGSSIAELAGKNIKKSVLELGGSDPYIILEDANLEEAVKACVISRLFNSGQTCISAKRFFVMRSQQKQVEELFVNEMSKFEIGSPKDSATNYGPLAREDIRGQLHCQVQASIKQGAKCILGGNIPDKKGYHYEATVLTDVEKGVTAFEEETFGPVAAIIPVNSEEEAIKLANDTVYGLGGAVFTKDIERGKKVAEKLEVGFCAVNDFLRSDPRLPFGGIKNSGYGREISYHGIKEFVNVKPIYVK